MTLQNIIDKLTSINIAEKRTISEEYGEIVLLNKDLSTLNKIFADIFGEPEKKQGVKPSKDILLLTKDYGGIWENQTLFKKDNGENIIIAMLWPWQDNIHTTLKMAAIRNK
ncbi:MAG: hypothetical protein M0R20_05820 [Candidatus Omnitrophica bacterium]|jgi:hypothetical protein|nr:hypothetical protein [Candidatus Omnitrophota bacterium]